MKENKSKFFKVACEACNAEQIVFSNSSREVKCSACEKVLVLPKAGYSEIKGKLIQELKR